MIWNKNRGGAFVRMALVGSLLIAAQTHAANATPDAKSDATPAAKLPVAPDESVSEERASTTTRRDIPDPTRILNNLVYYPHGGEFLLQASYNGFLGYSSSTENYAGTETSTAKDTYDQVGLALTYGIVDRLRLELSESEVIDRNNTSTKDTTGTVTETNPKGYSDPTLTLSYRYCESLEKGHDADVVWAVTPKTGNHYSATSWQTGNNLQGGWTTSLSLPFYWIVGMQELGLTPAATYNFGETTLGTTINNSSATLPYWTESIRLADRIHFGTRFYLQPSLTINVGRTYNTISDAPNSTDVSRTTAMYYNPNLAVGYLITHALIITAAVGEDRYVTDSSFAKQTSNTEASVNETTGTVTLGYAF